MRKKIWLGLIILILMSMRVSASDEKMLFVSPDHIFTIRFNMPIESSEIIDGAVIFTDERNLLLPFELYSGSDKREVKLKPKDKLDVGKIYTVTVRKGKLSHNKSIKNEYSKKAALEINTALSKAYEFYDSLKEGSKEGEVAFGTRNAFHNALIRLTDRAPYIKTDFEKALWANDLKEAVNIANRSRVIKHSGEVVCEEKRQYSSRISFYYKFLKDKRLDVENNLLGFEIKIEPAGEFQPRFFIPKGRSETLEPDEVPDTSGDELKLTYKNIDVTSLLRGLPKDYYKLKIKPVFKNVSSEVIYYTKDSSCSLISEGDSIVDKSLRYLSWANILEIPYVKDAERYEAVLMSGKNSERLSLGSKEVSETENALGYLMTPLRKSYCRYLNMGRYPKAIDFLKVNKNSGISTTCSLFYYDKNGRLINEIPKVPIEFGTDLLPKVSSIYNLSKDQEKSILNPNKEYEIFPLERGNILSIETNTPATLHIFSVLLNNSSDFDWEIILKDYVNDIRYKNYDTKGLYKDFRSRLLSTHGRILIKEHNVVEKSDSQGIIRLNTSRLEKGKYFLVIEDKNGIYYPIENMILNLFEENKRESIKSISYKNGVIKFEYDPGDYGYHFLSAFVLTESQYHDYIEAGNTREKISLLKRLERENRLISETISDKPYAKGTVPINLKANPSNETLFLVLLEGDKLEVKEVRIP